MPGNSSSNGIEMRNISEDYPISKILIWLVSVIVAGIIGFYLNELLH